MLIYTFRLIGPAVSAARVPGSVARELLEAVERGARGAVRLRLEGRSSAKGPLPAWLYRAAAFDLIGLVQDAAGVRLQAPTLREALPEQFVQADMFWELDPDKTALTFMAESLEDALRGQEDSEIYDDSLLATFEESFGELLRRGVDAVEIRNGSLDSAVVQVTSSGLRSVEELHRRTPAPRRVRLAGQLDAIRYSDRAFTLLLPTGKPVRGVLAEGGPEVLAPLFGKVAVVSGTAHFRPSAALLRIDAEHIAVGTDKDLEAWGALPRPLDLPLEARALRKPQGPRSGLNALFGQWEDDLEEEEIFRLLKELS